MEREILFRGKHIHILPQNEHLDGTWIYGYLCDENYINTVDEDEYGEKFTSEMLVDPKTVCQYTGLTDKAGKKIFENDIVTLEDYHGHRTAYVFYGEDYGCWFYGGDRFSDEYIFNGQQKEVIGNIFDNPELLNGEMT